MDSKSFSRPRDVSLDFSRSSRPGQLPLLEVEDGSKETRHPMTQRGCKSPARLPDDPAQKLGSCIHDALRTTDSRRTDQSTGMKVWNKTMHHFAETIRKQNPRGLPERKPKKMDETESRDGRRTPFRFCSRICYVIPRATSPRGCRRAQDSELNGYQNANQSPTTLKRRGRELDPGTTCKAPKVSSRVPDDLNFDNRPKKTMRHTIEIYIARRLSRFHPADVQTQTWSCIHETYPQSR